MILSVTKKFCFGVIVEMYNNNSIIIVEMLFRPQQAVKAIRARLQQRDGVIVDNVLTVSYQL